MNEELAEMLGAVYTWAWCEDFQEYHYVLIYWFFIVRYFLSGPQRAGFGPLFILAGFMSEARGRHWDRKSRRGIK